MIKIGVIGANGYTGYELMRLLSSHPKAKIVNATSRAHTNKLVAELYPSLACSYPALKFSDLDIEYCASICDVVFTALPHGVSAETCSALLASNKNLKVIDLSADFRYDSLPLFEKTYGIKHPAKKENAAAVYGLTEINRKDIKTARLIANPGCYPTASILGLLPLVKNGLVKLDSIIIDAKSGITGAGRQAKEDFSFCESAYSIKPYGVTTHRHTSEIEEKLGASNLNFTPHLLPVKRGILSTAYADLSEATNAKSIEKAYNQFYKKEKFVKVLPIMPELKFATNSNCCFIGFAVDKKTNRVIVASAIDNLIKGASGQAIQNMNLMFGLKEELGLPVSGNQL